MSASYGIEDMLKDIGGDNVEIVSQKEEKGKEEKKEVSKVSVLDNPDNLKEKVSKVSKKVESRKSKKKRGDKDYSTTMIRKDTISLIRLMLPDKFIQDAINSILMEWVDNNQKQIEQAVKKRLRKK